MTAPHNDQNLLGLSRAASGEVTRIVGEFWTSRQRQMHSLHYAVSYRASFKPELPDYFIRRYTKPGDVVFDPFAGRGTTILQANILGRIGWGNDINPLSALVTYAKTHPVPLDEITGRLDRIPLGRPVDMSDYERFRPFYHRDTYRELLNLRAFLAENRTDVDRFIEMVAISRLHGHSRGFFSAYSFPQISVTPQAQERINRNLGNKPEYRPIKPRILQKAKAILRDGQLDEIRSIAARNVLTSADARRLPLPSDSVDLIVTSPPFLNKADYLLDNWLEFWFARLDPAGFSENLVQTPCIETWRGFMRDAMREMNRVLKVNGVCVIEVGDIALGKRTVNLDEEVVSLTHHLLTVEPGYCLQVEHVLVNQQRFTKLANCFGVTNNQKGTNTNRLVVLSKKGTALIVRPDYCVPSQ